MKIAYVCLQPRGDGGASDTHVAGIVGAMRIRGHAVELVETRYRGRLLGRLVVCVGMQIRAAAAIRRSDVVWLRMHPLGIVTAWLAWRRVLVVEVNGVPEDFYVAHPGLRRLGLILKPALKSQLNRADHLLPVTEGLAAQLRRRFPDSVISVIPNGVDPANFSPDLPRPADAPNGDYVIYFGSLILWQGVDVALAATRERPWPHGVTLLVLGDGPDRAQVEAAAEASPGRVCYLGPVAPEAVPGYVAHACASLIPKRYHDASAGQSPLKLYESMAAGVPVIASVLTGATDLPQIADSLHVVEPESIAFAEAVARVIADPATARDRAARGRSAVLQGHTWAHRAALVEQVLGGPGLPLDG